MPPEIVLPGSFSLLPWAWCRISGKTGDIHAWEQEGHSCSLSNLVSQSRRYPGETDQVEMSPQGDWALTRQHMATGMLWANLDNFCKEL